MNISGPAAVAKPEMLFYAPGDLTVTLVRMIAAETPWYRFSQLLEIKNGIQSAIKHNETNL